MPIGRPTGQLAGIFFSLLIAISYKSRGGISTDLMIGLVGI